MTVNLDKTLPSDEETERIAIGDALLSGRLYGPLLDIAVTDFYNTNYAILWSVISEFHEENEAFSVVDLWQRVKDNKRFTLKISDITNTTFGLPVGATTAKHAQYLRELALKRKALRQITALSFRIFDGASLNDVTDELETVQREIAELRSDRKVFHSIGEVIRNDVHKRLDQFVSGESYRFPTGFSAIDEVTLGGVGVGELWVLAALTGGGKSAFALQIAVSLAGQGIPCAFVSREMLNYENGLRALSQLGRFNNGLFRSGLNELTARKIKDIGEELEPLPLFFDDKTSDIPTLKRNLARLVETEGIKVIFVDYLQLLGDKSTKGRQERLEYIINELKAFAMTHEVAVVVISQFNRNAGKLDVMPSIYDLDGASAIEKAGNVILTWKLEATEEADADNPKEKFRRGELHLAKGRHVGRGFLGIKYYGSQTRFEVF